LVCAKTETWEIIPNNPLHVFFPSIRRGNEMKKFSLDKEFVNMIKFVVIVAIVIGVAAGAGIGYLYLTQ